eukprot:Lankesteria_metandrocarpae@DN4976_c0_g1_i1.p1
MSNLEVKTGLVDRAMSEAINGLLRTHSNQDSWDHFDHLSPYKDGALEESLRSGIERFLSSQEVHMDNLGCEQYNNPHSSSSLGIRLKDTTAVDSTRFDASSHKFSAFLRQLLQNSGHDGASSPQLHIKNTFINLQDTQGRDDERRTRTESADAVLENNLGVDNRNLHHYVTFAEGAARMTAGAPLAPVFAAEQNDKMSFETMPHNAYSLDRLNKVQQQNKNAQPLLPEYPHRTPTIDVIPNSTINQYRDIRYPGHIYPPTVVLSGETPHHQRVGFNNTALPDVHQGPMDCYPMHEYSLNQQAVLDRINATADTLGDLNPAAVRAATCAPTLPQLPYHVGMPTGVPATIPSVAPRGLPLGIIAGTLPQRVPANGGIDIHAHAQILGNVHTSAHAFHTGMLPVVPNGMPARVSSPGVASPPAVMDGVDHMVGVPGWCGCNWGTALVPHQALITDFVHTTPQPAATGYPMENAQNGQACSVSNNGIIFDDLLVKSEQLGVDCGSTNDTDTLSPSVHLVGSSMDQQLRFLSPGHLNYSLPFFPFDDEVANNKHLRMMKAQSCPEQALHGSNVYHIPGTAEGVRCQDPALRRDPPYSGSTPTAFASVVPAHQKHVQGRHSMELPLSGAVRPGNNAGKSRSASEDLLSDSVYPNSFIFGRDQLASQCSLSRVAQDVSAGALDKNTYFSTLPNAVSVNTGGETAVRTLAGLNHRLGDCQHESISLGTVADRAVKNPEFHDQEDSLSSADTTSKNSDRRRNDEEAFSLDSFGSTSTVETLSDSNHVGIAVSHGKRSSSDVMKDLAAVEEKLKTTSLMRLVGNCVPFDTSADVLTNIVALDDFMRCPVDEFPSVRSEKTTVMLRNIPNKYSLSMLLGVLNVEFKGLYDFCYLPIDFWNKCNVGYAFINFIHPVITEQFRLRFHGFKLNAFKSNKVCVVSYGRVQGLRENIEHYRNSAVLSVRIAEYKPAIFDRDGNTVAFPDADGPLPAVKPRLQKSGRSSGPKANSSDQ